MSTNALQPRTAVTNVLVIGTGAAGLRAAIAAHDAGCQVLALGKRLRKDAHTVLAAGGINAALGSVDPQDRWEQHFADTVREGYALGHPRMVEILARESPRAVLELAEWGCPFARTPEGRLDQRFFGAHTYRRTCYAGDYTGRAVLTTLADRVATLGIPILERQYISHLLVHEGVCFGALGFDLDDGQRTVYLADAVILAAGGHTRLWRRSSSRRDENTGDGMALALQAGCSLADMELVQFHPTGMLWPEEVAGTLVTEAVRGEGGRLFNARGERFMARYDPQRMELSTRDRVALANYAEIMAGRGGPHGGVFLDASHLSKELILEKLPRMYRQFMETQLLDISRQPMEVAPTAHYSMGGVVVDPDSTATEVEGLYAAGEVTGGLHGANRLGGNSLAETVVFGRLAGEHGAARSARLEVQQRSRRVIGAASESLDATVHPGSELARPLQRALRDAMWEGCGVLRDAPRLEGALRRIGELQAVAGEVDVRPSSEGYLDLALALDLRGALLVAEATVRGALQRAESRGAHQRADHPQLDPALTLGFRTRRTWEGKLETAPVPLPPVPDALRALVEEGEELNVAGRLLE
jgi:succinate dehydrogenase / fumarate reductase flavoprotein subunit